MHSSRMRTACLRIVLGGGVVTWSQGGREGGVVTWSQGREVLSRGKEGVERERCCDLVLGRGRCCPGGGREVLSRGREVLSRGGGGRPLVLPTSPLRVEVTHTCENIAFARFATRAVKIGWQHLSRKSWIPRGTVPLIFAVKLYLLLSTFQSYSFDQNLSC